MGKVVNKIFGGGGDDSAKRAAEEARRRAEAEAEALRIKNENNMMLQNSVGSELGGVANAGVSASVGDMAQFNPQRRRKRGTASESLGIS